MVARAGASYLTPAHAADAPLQDSQGLNEEARRAVATCYVNGVISGSSATTFAPYGQATRGHAAKTTWRLYEKRP
jgi:hypothetical protein